MAFFLGDTSKIWENGVVPFIIDSTDFPQNSEEYNKIIAAINEMNNNTNVNFQPRTNEADFLHFTTNTSTCESSVGKQGGEQIITCNLSKGNFDTGNLLHEMMHALGFLHEHTRTDRSPYIAINYANVKRKQDFDIYDAGQNLTAYDYGSILHYPSQITNPSLVFNTTIDTLTALQSIPISVIVGQRGKLSDLDIVGINTIYTKNSLQKTIYPVPITQKVKDNSPLIIIGVAVFLFLLLLRRFFAK